MSTTFAYETLAVSATPASESFVNFIASTAGWNWVLVELSNTTIFARYEIWVNDNQFTITQQSGTLPTTFIYLMCDERIPPYVRIRNVGHTNSTAVRVSLLRNYPIPPVIVLR